MMCFPASLTFFDPIRLAKEANNDMESISILGWRRISGVEHMRDFRFSGIITPLLGVLRWQYRVCFVHRTARLGTAAKHHTFPQAETTPAS